MLDWEGNIFEKRNRTHIKFNAMTTSSAKVSDAESNLIGNILQRSNNNLEEKVHPCWKPNPQAAEEILSIFSDISPLLDNQFLYEQMKALTGLGKFQVSIGSTNASKDDFLVHGYNDSTTVTVETVEEDDEQILGKLVSMSTKGGIDLDKIMVSAAHAFKSKVIDSANLSKV